MNISFKALYVKALSFKGLGATISLLLALPLLTVSTVSAAETEGSRLLSKYDLNGDERITQSEIMSKKLDVFRYLDSDKDGSVSFSEYESMDAARRENLLKARFAKIDGNRDSIVTEEEYSQFLGLFSSLDSNGDGTLSSDEMRVAEVSEQSNNHCLLWFCFRTSLD